MYIVKNFKIFYYHSMKKKRFVTYFFMFINPNFVCTNTFKNNEQKVYILFLCHTYEGVIALFECIFYYFEKYIDSYRFCVRKAQALTKYYIFSLFKNLEINCILNSCQSYFAIEIQCTIINTWIITCNEFF